MTIGFVYVALNAGFPGRSKIGKAVDPDKRIAQLQRHYGTPKPYTKYCAYRMPDYSRVEAYAHRKLADVRDYKTEMFVCSPEEAEAVVLWAHDEVLKLQIAPRPTRAPKRWRRAGRYSEGSYLWSGIITAALLIIGCLYYLKPDLPDWLPEPVTHTALIIENWP